MTTPRRDRPRPQNAASYSRPQPPREPASTRRDPFPEDREYLVAASRRPVGSSSLWDGGPRDTGGRPPRREDPPFSPPLRASWNPTVEPPRPRAERDHSDRPARAAVRRRSALGWFLHRYGWRAYALPLLVAATVFVILDIAQNPVITPVEDSSAAAPGSFAPAPVTVVTTISGVEATVTESAAPVTVTQEPETAPDPNGTFNPGISPGVLPPGGDYAVEGDGTYRIVPGISGQIGTSSDVRTFTVEIENGVTIPGGDEDFANQVVTTLSDPRSWTAVKDVSLQRIDSGTPDFRVTLTSQMTVRGICGFTVQLESSCNSSDIGRVVINDARWVRGALSYAGDLSSYRQYAINHEVGHALGYGHQPCQTDGGLAPVMMQQSWSVSDDELNAINGSVAADGKVCKPNPWPDPLGGEGEATATG